MNVQVKVTIDAPAAAVWAVSTDMEHYINVISGIESVEILERPETGLVGLKWPQHDRASELDSWDCVDELVAEEDYSQEWGEAASR